jgi:hypothetical protein
MSDRNNDQRLGVDVPASESFKKQESKAADLLSFLNPTVFIDLPSKGKFYPNGHPLKDKDTVEIRFMTAKEEDILTSRSLLKKGIAIDRMLESVIVDKNIEIESLLVGDKNALVVGARITGYGSLYETKVQCPNCGTNCRNAFDLNKIKYIYPSEEIETQLIQNNTFKVSLPISKLEVEIRLLKGQDEKILLSMTEERKASKQEERISTDQLKISVVSVNGITDRNMINKFSELCPAGDSRFLRKLYSENSPNIDLTQKFSCKSCDAEMDMEVPFTVDFFWTGR